jgi:hypothetical protein
LVDNCQDLAKLASKNGDVQFATGEDRKTREDSHRLKIAPGSSVTYRVDEPIDSWSANVFFVDEAAKLVVSTSEDGEHFEPCKFTAEEMSKAKNDYNYLRFVVLHGDKLPPNAKYLRLEFPESGNPEETAQLGRVVIHYGKVAE